MKLYEHLSDEVNEVLATQAAFDDHVWQLYFDGALRTGPDLPIMAGVEVVHVSPQKHLIPRAFSLTESCSKYMAEYDDLLTGMKVAREVGAKNLETYSDSILIVNQVHREYEVRHELNSMLLRRLHNGRRIHKFLYRIYLPPKERTRRCIGVSRNLPGPIRRGARENLGLGS